MDSDIDGTIEAIENEEFDADDQPTQTRDPPSEEGISDGELESILESRQTEITVVGCGGAGCNTIDRMYQEGIEGAQLVALNTDVQHLSKIGADSKLLVGQSLTGGKGTGSVPEIGKKAAMESEQSIEDTVEGADMVFVTAGLGGGTGTGTIPVVARAARAADALTVAVVTLPFTAEGKLRRDNADMGLDQLRAAADTVIVIPNDRLLDTVGDLPVQQAFKVSDEILMRAVKGITELITRSLMVNLDFSDVETVMESGGVAMIGFGESDSDAKALDALRSAIRSPLLDVDISGADAALVNVTGGPEMTIDEAEGVVEELYDRVDPGARIIWGTGIDEGLGDTIQTMIVVTGVSSEQVYGGDSDQQSAHTTDIDYTE